MTVDTPAPHTATPKQDRLKEQVDDIGPKDSTSQVSKSLILFSNILKQFKDELLKKRAELETNVQDKERYYKPNTEHSNQTLQLMNKNH